MSLEKAMQRIIVPPKFSATFISKTFYPYEHQHKMHSSINTGRCYDWAFIAHTIWPYLTLWSTDHHAWVENGGRYFDSECPRGRKRYKDMPCNQLCGGMGRAKPQTSEEFARHWDHNGGGRTHHWHKLVDEIIAKGIRLPAV